MTIDQQTAEILSQAAICFRLGFMLGIFWAGIHLAHYLFESEETAERLANLVLCFFERRKWFQQRLREIQEKRERMESGEHIEW